MRLLRAAALLITGISGLAVAGAASLGCLDLTQTSADDAGAAAATSDGGAAAEAGVVGGGCGIEQGSGIELCAATSMCPSVVVDTQAMPTCGFRVRGAVVDLVCACGTAICPVGAFSTCAEASQLLTNQTAQGVCVQVAEGRCLEAAGTSSSSSSSSGGAGGNPACDRQCMQECGGGAGCASVCNCD
jgi:hypothetical protein